MSRQIINKTNAYLLLLCHNFAGISGCLQRFYVMFPCLATAAVLQPPAVGQSHLLMATSPATQL